ncbi:hypothetical protein L345_11763, partial [Ophiophagus hannah]
MPELIIRSLQRIALLPSKALDGSRKIRKQAEVEFLKKGCSAVIESVRVTQSGEELTSGMACLQKLWMLHHWRFLRAWAGICSKLPCKLPQAGHPGGAVHQSIFSWSCGWPPTSTPSTATSRLGFFSRPAWTNMGCWAGGWTIERGVSNLQLWSRMWLFGPSAVAPCWVIPVGHSSPGLRRERDRETHFPRKTLGATKPGDIELAKPTQAFVAPGVFFSMGNGSKWLFECLRLQTPGLEDLQREGRKPGKDKNKIVQEGKKEGRKRNGSVRQRDGGKEGKMKKKEH